MRILAPFLLAALLPVIAHAQHSRAIDAQQRIRKISLPSISFKNATLMETLDSLRQRSVDLDGDPDPTRRGVSFVVVDGTAAAANPIDYQGTDVTLAVVLRQIGSEANVDIYITSVGIVVCPVGTAPFPNPEARIGEVLEKIT